LEAPRRAYAGLDPVVCSDPIIPRKRALTHLDEGVEHIAAG
jgi:hypothetical protein